MRRRASSSPRQQQNNSSEPVIDEVQTERFAAKRKADPTVIDDLKSKKWQILFSFPLPGPTTPEKYYEIPNRHQSSWNQPAEPPKLQSMSPHDWIRSFAICKRPIEEGTHMLTEQELQLWDGSPPEIFQGRFFTRFMEGLPVLFAISQAGIMQKVFGSDFQDIHHFNFQFWTQHPIKTLLLPVSGTVYFVATEHWDLSPSIKGTPSLIAWKSKGAAEPLTLSEEQLRHHGVDTRPQLVYIQYKATLGKEGAHLCDCRVYAFHAPHCRCRVCCTQRGVEHVVCGQVSYDGTLGKFALVQILDAEHSRIKNTKGLSKRPNGFSTPSPSPSLKRPSEASTPASAKQPRMLEGKENMTPASTPRRGGGAGGAGRGRMRRADLPRNKNTALIASTLHTPAAKPPTPKQKPSPLLTATPTKKIDFVFETPRHQQTLIPAQPPRRRGNCDAGASRKLRGLEGEGGSEGGGMEETPIQLEEPFETDTAMPADDASPPQEAADEEPGQGSALSENYLPMEEDRSDEVDALWKSLTHL